MMSKMRFNRNPGGLFPSLPCYLKCQFITKFSQDNLCVQKKRDSNRGGRGEEKLPFNRQKPRAEPDSV